MKNLIGKELIDFEVQAYHEGDFKTVTKEDVLGKWGVFFFYPADFTFVCPTELADVADNYEEFKKSAVKFIRFLKIPILYIKPGRTPPTPLRAFRTRC